jgi:hypothetical protein
MTPEKMRQKICDGLLAAEEEILPDCPYTSTDFSERQKLFREEISVLRKSGSRSTSWMSEILPLISANVLDRPAKVFYSNNPEIVVQDVVPKNEDASEGKAWLYYVVRSDGHFDFCIPSVNAFQESDSDPNIEVSTTSGRQSRVRRRNPAAWQDSVRKRKRNSGQCYVARSGKVRQERLMKAGCGHGCKR